MHPSQSDCVFLVGLVGILVVITGIIGDVGF